MHREDGEEDEGEGAVGGIGVGGRVREVRGWGVG